MDNYINQIINLFNNQDNDAIFYNCIEQIIESSNYIDTEIQQINESIDTYTDIDIDIDIDIDNIDIDIDINQRIIQNMYILRRNLELRQNIPSTSIPSIPHINSNIITRSISSSIFEDIFDSFTTLLEDQINYIENLQDIKVILSQNEFDKLNSVLNKNETSKDCPICLCKCEINDKLIILKCSHIYHIECIHEWFTKNSTKCCVCRKDVREELTLGPEIKNNF